MAKAQLWQSHLFTGSITDKLGKRYVGDEPVLITTSCAGPWCARLPEENASGYFLLKAGDDSALSLHIGACTFQPFTVTDEQAKALEACATPEPVIPKIRPKGVKK